MLEESKHMLYPYAQSIQPYERRVCDRLKIGRCYDDSYKILRYESIQLCPRNSFSAWRVERRTFENRTSLCLQFSGLVCIGIVPLSMYMPLVSIKCRISHAQNAIWTSGRWCYAARRLLAHLIGMICSRLCGATSGELGFIYSSNWYSRDTIPIAKVKSGVLRGHLSFQWT